MTRRIRLAAHLSIDELERRYRAAYEPHERTWWQIVWLLAKGHTATELASVTSYSVYWIGQLAKRYNAAGPAAMINRQHTRPRSTPTLLSSAQIEELLAALAGPIPEGARWSGRVVGQWASGSINGRYLAALGVHQREDSGCNEARDSQRVADESLGEPPHAVQNGGEVDGGKLDQ